MAAFLEQDTSSRVYEDVHILTVIYGGETVQPIAVEDNDETDTSQFPSKADWSCARSFNKAEWDKAYICWKEATNYDSALETGSLYIPPSKKRVIEETTEADPIELDCTAPEEVPNYFQKFLKSALKRGNRSTPRTDSLKSFHY